MRVDCPTVLKRAFVVSRSVKIQQWGSHRDSDRQTGPKKSHFDVTWPPGGIVVRTDLMVISLMVYSHCTEAGPGHVQGTEPEAMGTNICCTEMFRLV